jgi:HrpA-like RNA helicase
MAALPAHPRFAHMVLRAQQLGVAELGCLLAALLSERDLFRGSSSSGRGGSSGTDPGADLTTRLKVLAGAGVTRHDHSAYHADAPQVVCCLRLLVSCACCSALFWLVTATCQNPGG